MTHKKLLYGVWKFEPLIVNGDFEGVYCNCQYNNELIKIFVEVELVGDEFQIYEIEIGEKYNADFKYIRNVLMDNHEFIELLEDILK